MQQITVASKSPRFSLTNPPTVVAINNGFTSVIWKPSSLLYIIDVIIRSRRYSKQKMRPIATHAAWSVCACAYLLVTTVSPETRLNRSRCCFGVWTQETIIRLGRNLPPLEGVLLGSHNNIMRKLDPVDILNYIR